jgi:hypothetical protein
MAQRVIIQDGRVIYTSSDPTTVDVEFSIAGSLDASGNISIAGDPAPTVSSTTLNFNSASIVSAVFLPTNSVILSIEVVVDTTFNGAPTVSVGITGNTSKYATTSSIDLLDAPEDVSLIYNGKTPTVSDENVNLYYTAGGASVGSARVIITYTRLTV